MRKLTQLMGHVMRSNLVLKVSGIFQDEVALVVFHFLKLLYLKTRKKSLVKFA